MFRKYISRRKALKSIITGSVGLSLPITSLGITDPVMKRAIPTSGEKIGVVGVGTYRTFNVGSSELERRPLKEVLKLLVESGGSA